MRKADIGMFLVVAGFTPELTPRLQIPFLDHSEGSSRNPVFMTLALFFPQPQRAIKPPTSLKASTDGVVKSSRVLKQAADVENGIVCESESEAAMCAQINGDHNR